jgi:hypothetical protein
VLLPGVSLVDQDIALATATIEEKAWFGLFLFFNQGITPWLTCKTSPEGLEMVFNFLCPVSAAAS